jgi:ABC-2 type transport system permease protein
MGAWRLELLRLWRTRRVIALTAIFVIAGLGDPVLTYYLPELVKAGGSAVAITLPKQTAADGFRGFAGSAAQLGTLVIAIVAAASLTIDSRPVLAAFYRTRLRRPGPLLLPRYVVVTAAAIAALALGTLSAWYECSVLLGPLSPADLAGGFGLEALWICFSVSLVAAFTGVVRGVLAVAGWSVGLLLALSALGGVIPALSSWLPTRLAGSAAALVGPAPVPDLWHAVLVTGSATIALLALALRRLGRREL